MCERRRYSFQVDIYNRQFFSGSVRVVYFKDRSIIDRSEIKVKVNNDIVNKQFDIYYKFVRVSD